MDAAQSGFSLGDLPEWATISQILMLVYGGANRDNRSVDTALHRPIDRTRYPV